MGTTKKPNILWICTDQQRFDTINALGNQFINTPTLDKLAQSGVAFMRTYAQSTVCSPSRASFLTGRYPRTTGVTKNGGEYFPPNEILVTKMLSDSGYSCGLVGKLHLSAAENMLEKRPDDGYQEFHWSHNPRPEWKRSENKYQLWLEECGIDWQVDYKGRDGGIDPHYHQTTWCVNEAIKFIDSQSKKDAPWLLSVNIYDPHPPFDPPKEYRDRYITEDMPLPKWREGELETKPMLQKEDFIQGGQGGNGPSCSQMTDYEKQQYVADYYAMIELIDDQIGRLLNALTDFGEQENTVIIFHSDHGEMLGDHGLILKGAYFYEGLVHVPLIISWPGKIKENIQSHALVELVDLAPTILELCGLEVPSFIQGKSLHQILMGEASPDLHKKDVYTEYYYALPDSHQNVYATMYFDGRYKLIVYHGEEIGELYDLEQDPDEFINLWNTDEYQQLKMQLLIKSFDRSVFTVDPNPPFIARY